MTRFFSFLEYNFPTCGALPRAFVQCIREKHVCFEERIVNAFTSDRVSVRNGIPLSLLSLL